MPAYSYTALNEAGIKKKGILSADSEREARKLVKDLKLTPIKVSVSKDLSKALKIKEKDVIVMTNVRWQPWGRGSVCHGSNIMHIVNILKPH